MSMGRKLIWSSHILSVRRWLQRYKKRISDEDYAVFSAAVDLFLRKNKQDPDTYDDVQSVMSEKEEDLLKKYNDLFLDQERRVLSVGVGSPIILIAFNNSKENATLGYKVIRSGIIADCLKTENTHVDWYIDASGDLRCDILDGILGSVCYLYRAVKDEITEVQLKEFLSEILDGHIPAERITTVTKRLGPMITDAYGLSRRGYLAYGKE